MEKVHCFALSYIKYKDHDAIFRGFSLEGGFQSFYIRGLYSPKNKKKSYLSPLFPLVIAVQVDTKNGSLPIVQHLEPMEKDISPPSFGVGAMFFFIADFLCQVLRHEGENRELFQLIREFYKEASEGNHQSHLIFLVRYIALCGFAPLLSSGKFLEAESGVFVENSSGRVFSEEISFYWKEILMAENPFAVRVFPKDRRNFLESILLYYRFHHPEFVTPKSLEVLYEVID